MARTFYTSTTASDLTSGGSFSNAFADAQEAVSSITLTAAAGNGTDQGSYFTAIGVPGTGGTSTGTFTIRTNIATAQAGVNFRVNLMRVNSAGTVQTTVLGTYAAASAGLRTQTFTNPALGTWASGDRFRVQYQIQNTNTMGGSKGITFETGQLAQDTPFAAPSVPAVTGTGAVAALAPTATGNGTHTAPGGGGGTWAFSVVSQLDSTDNQSTPYTSPSYTPTADRLLIAVVTGRSAASFTVDPTVTGNGLTFTHVVSRLAGVYQGMFAAKSGASPTAGGVSADFGGGISLTGCAIHVIEVNGSDLSGTAIQAIAQSATNNGSGATTGSVTLGTAPLSASAVFGSTLLASAAEDVTAGTGATEISDGNFATPVTTTHTQWQTATTSTTVESSWTTSSGWTILGAEVKAGASGPTGTTGTGSVSAQAPTASATGSSLLAITGTAAVTTLAPTAASSGAAGVAPVTGTGAGTAPAPTASSTGVLRFTGTGAATGQAPIASSIGTALLAITGTGAATGLPPTASLAGDQAFDGAGAVTSQAPQASAEGSALLAITGTAAVSVPAPIASGSGAGLAPAVNGAASVVAQAPTVSASGTYTAQPISGTASVTTQAPTASASGNADDSTVGTAAVTSTAPTATASGGMRFVGTGDASVLGPEVSGSGGVLIPITGTASVSVPAPTALAVGVRGSGLVGAVAVTTQPPLADASGVLRFTGTATGTSPAPLADASGVWRLDTTGFGAVTGQPPTATGLGSNGVSVSDVQVVSLISPATNVVSTVRSQQRSSVSEVIGVFSTVESD